MGDDLVCNVPKLVPNITLPSSNGFLPHLHGLMIRRTNTFCHTVSLASNDNGPRRLSVPRRRLLPGHSLPYRLPVQATEGELHDSNLPPQHQLQRQHLSRHPSRPVEPSSHNLKRHERVCTHISVGLLTFYSTLVHLLNADRPEPRRPSRSRDRSRLQD
jgi:hypothetical protein